eukprot:TRINITY_DN43271_c0_g1_i1.p1 TRINITY_DN43271_c0_g1~~TRINITY_DN43271_c0_g1_i1.p1  ORF type:complete len:249 (+),score=25.84 TRINITY_DN43271_c0_g1_i1:478-1224(+)
MPHGCFLKKTLCRSEQEIVEVLQSSNFVARDVLQPYIYCLDGTEEKDLTSSIKDMGVYGPGPVSISSAPTNVLAAPSEDGPRAIITLRKYRSILMNTEFRLFVKESKLIGACQRDIATYYPDFAEESYCDEIRSMIIAFFNSTISEVYPGSDYVVDVSVDSSKDKVKILDFGPFGGCTDSLLFDWMSLKKTTSDSEFDFRVVDRGGVQPGTTHYSGLPFDLRETNPNTLAELAKHIQKTKTTEAPSQA